MLNLTRGHLQAIIQKLVFYQTSVGIWPREPALLPVIAAILNGPVANAYIATRESSDITNETLRTIPVPRLVNVPVEEIKNLVAQYVDVVQEMPFKQAVDLSSADAILRRIDAAVLIGYDLPTRTERKLLDYFRSARRPVPFAFGDYFPEDFEPYFSLAYYLSEEYRASTAGSLISRWKQAPDGILKAMTAAVESYEEE